MRDGLMPCPFCGGEFKASIEPDDAPYVGGQIYIYHVYGPLGSAARKCRMSVEGHFESMEEARLFWNTRVPAE